MGWMRTLAGLLSPFRLAVPPPQGPPEVLTWHRQALLAFLEDQLPHRPSILDTAPGDFALALLRLDPRELMLIGLDASEWQELRAQWVSQGICTRSLEVHLDAARWVLPRLTATVRERIGRFDLVRLGQCEAWPSAFLELAHAGALLRRGGFLVIDGLSPRFGAHRRAEPPGYRLVLEFGSGLVFQKISHYSSLHDWQRPGTVSVLPPRPALPV